MKKKVVSVFLVSTLLFGCGSTKNVPSEKKEPKKEVVSEQNDPLMKLLLSGLVIYTVHILFAR
tara:strand:+ start:168 stop:356 length:189 start_codon:yes stop_codon:yes gene_type:complete